MYVEDDNDTQEEHDSNKFYLYESYYPNETYIKNYMKPLNISLNTKDEEVLRRAHHVLIKHITNIFDCNENYTHNLKRILYSKLSKELLDEDKDPIEQVIKPIITAGHIVLEYNMHAIFISLIILLINGIVKLKGDAEIKANKILQLLEYSIAYRTNTYMNDYVINSLVLLFIAKNADKLQPRIITKILKKLNMSPSVFSPTINRRTFNDLILNIAITSLAINDETIYIAISLIPFMDSFQIERVLNNTTDRILDSEDEHGKTLRQHLKYRQSILKEIEKKDAVNNFL